jgi:hypothetical protein
VGGCLEEANWDDGDDWGTGGAGIGGATELRWDKGGGQIELLEGEDRKLAKRIKQKRFYKDPPF